MSNVIEVTNLVKKYNSFSINNISFSVPKGYICGFIGPNGSGKTTTIKSILDIINPDSGEIKIFEKDISVASEKLKDKIGIVMDETFYSDDWTVKEVEKAIKPFYTKWDSEKFNKLISKFSINPDKKVKELSKGMHIKLMLASAFSHNAELIILDEPTSGLDPVAREELLEILSDYIQDENNSVFFSTHITTDLEKIADYIVFILNGNICFSGEVNDLIEKYILIKGDSSNINALLKKEILGYRELNGVFEGIIESEKGSLFSDNVLMEKVNLDEIIIFMNREGYNHE